MIKFKQLIRPGQKGRDVKAVKRALLAMGVKGSGSLGKTNKAGPAFVKCIKHVQGGYGLKQDGIYGKEAHKHIAPNFDTYAKWLYKTCKLRKPKIPKITDLGAQEAAKKILASGKYHADNPADLSDIQRTAAGLPVWSHSGQWVHLDKRLMEALLYLIEQGHRIGTYAICSDHPYDGPHGHAGGLACDISSIDGISVSYRSDRTRTLTLAVANLLHHHMPSGLSPWQLICDGYGYIYDSAIAAEIIPYAGFYDYSTLAQHRNHIHLGYYR